MESDVLVIVDHDRKQFHVANDEKKKSYYDLLVEEANEAGRDVGVFYSHLNVEQTIDAAQHEYKGYTHRQDSPV